MPLNPPSPSNNNPCLPYRPPHLRNARFQIGLKRPASEIFKSFRKKKKRRNKTDEKPLRRSRCGACIISQCGSKVLLVKQKEAQKWSFPKGSKEKYESKEDCMIRELLEETGIKLNSYNYDTLDCVKRYRYYIFILKLQQSEKFIKLNPQDKHEIEKASWVTFKDLQKGQYTMNYVTKSVLERNKHIPWEGSGNDKDHDGYDSQHFKDSGDSQDLTDLTDSVNSGDSSDSPYNSGTDAPEAPVDFLRTVVLKTHNSPQCTKVSPSCAKTPALIICK